MDDFELSIEQTENFRSVARDIRRAGREVQRELYSALNRATEPLKEIARSGADRLPQSGGRDRRVTRMRRTGAVVINGVEYVTRERVRTGRTKANDSVADRVRAAKFSTKLRGGRNPTVTLMARDSRGKSMDLRALDEGRLRHPVFGNRRTWVTQRVNPQWWTGPLTGAEALRTVREELIAAVETTARRILGG